MYTTQQFAAFLERRNVAVLDVTRGASPDCRRLLVGDVESGLLTHAVAVAYRVGTNTGVDTEESVLSGLPGLLCPELLATVPKVVERVEVATAQTGLVVRAVRGLGQPDGGANQERTPVMLAAIDTWLAAVWRDTAGESAPTDLGDRATTTVMERYAGSPRLAPALASIGRARRNLSEFDVRRTLTHGCLCRRHTRTDHGVLIGVDDWGLGARAGDPLRDLGRVAVGVSAGRLPEVVAGRTSYAGAVRDFVASGLERNAVPRQLWRAVLVLTQLELAVAALDRGEPDGIALLITAVRALPAKS
ncbi:MAG TPA: hypothetical protein VFG63_06275 [Nocardioidaceae bacterium]|nr:hypothetical protein [Nocardioidaceae bacterium]